MNTWEHPLRKIVLAFLTGALVCVGLVVVGVSPASAAGVSFESPADTARVLRGFHTFKVQLLGQPAGTYFVDVSGCDDRYDESVSFQHDGVDQVHSVELPPLDCSGGYSFAHLWNTKSTGSRDTILETIVFYVDEPDPAPNFSSFSVSPQTIYSTVQDGFRDGALITWDAMLFEAGRIDILNSSGAVIASRSSEYEDSFTWRGRNGAGKVFPAGTYRVRLAVWNSQNVQKQAFKNLYIVRDYTTRRVTKSRPGYQSTSESTGKNCTADISNYNDGLTLDCWSGRHATAKYAFQIPANARDIRWSVSREFGCCSRGTYSQKGKRVSRTKFVVTVKITGWRSVTIDQVSTSYATKKWW